MPTQLRRDPLGEEEFGQLLHLLRRLALVLDEPIGSAGHPQAEKPPKGKRTTRQE